MYGHIAPIPDLCCFLIIGIVEERALDAGLFARVAKHGEVTIALPETSADHRHQPVIGSQIRVLTTPVDSRTPCVGPSTCDPRQIYLVKSSCTQLVNRCQELGQIHHNPGHPSARCGGVPLFYLPLQLHRYLFGFDVRFTSVQPPSGVRDVGEAVRLAEASALSLNTQTRTDVAEGLQGLHHCLGSIRRPIPARIIIFENCIAQGVHVRLPQVIRHRLGTHEARLFISVDDPEATEHHVQGLHNLCLPDKRGAQILGVQISHHAFEEALEVR
mmetsp:Transcript_59013/g.149813  ORF Transcript_59013/g.149813 Transcript_59013/m.149813 type:complete len:272 (+) Transcript_59013:160-975(+)